jgi:uncharacterized repeat protein (TIGR02543 family)
MTGKNMGKIASGFCRQRRFQSAGLCCGLAVLVFLAVLAGCANAAGPDGNGNGPLTGNTFIQFDNSQGMFPVSVHTSPDRQGDSKIADLNALGMSGPMAWIPQSSGASFYFSYTLSIQSVQLIFVPPGDKGVVAPRIDEGKTTIIPLPALDQVVDNKDDPLCSESYVAIKNQGAYTFRLQQGNTVIERDDYPASLINAGETGVYKLKAGDASVYSLLINATSLSLPVTVLEAGRLYSLQFDGSVLTLLADKPLTIAQALEIMPPENISAASLPDGSISLTWDRAGTETGYVIYRADSETGTYTSIGNTAVTSYTDTTAAVGNIYYYRISSVKNNVEGGKSGVAVSDDGAVRYTVTFDAGGGAPATQTRTVVDGGIVGTLNMPSEPARNNYTFGGWYTERNGGGDKFYVDTFITGNITIYAKWTVIQYTVTFDADGGSPAGEQKTVNSGAWVGTPNMPAAPARNTYIFGGWYTAKNGGGSQFYVDTVVTGNITVYAKWTLDSSIQYTVTFDADGGSPATQTLTVTNGGFAGSGMPSDPARSGYVFGGWYTAVNGGGTRFTAETTVTGGGITVYARWTAQHTVTFDADDGSSSIQTRAVLDGNSVGVSNMPSDPSRTHYTFGGWYTAKNGGGTEFTASTAVTGDITVYAEWTIIQYTVTFNADGGNPAAQTKTVDSGSSVSNMPEPARTGYTFGGWYTAVNGGGTQFTGTTTVSGNITVYAKWTAQTYTVTFKSNYGANATLYTKMVTVPATTITDFPANPSRTGYTFGGWNTQAGGGGSNFTVSTRVTGNITVYAKWTAQTYTVTFMRNYAPDTVLYTKTVTAPATIIADFPANPSRTGYTFGGWNTQAGGGGSGFTASTAVTGNITVYAKWTAQTYTVTFKSNYGTNTTLYTKTVTVPATTITDFPAVPSRTGYVFRGWNTQADGGGSGFTASTAVTGNITVYAWWGTFDDLSLNDALTWISINAATGDAYTITLKNNETIAPKSLNYSGKTVGITLSGETTERIVSLSTTGSLFTVESGVTLTLDNNVTLQGRSDNTYSLVQVNSGGTFVINTGSKISGNTTSSTSSSPYGGGGVYVFGGTFTMSGGEISGNTVSSTYSSSFPCGGGVSVSNGTFTMSGGKISGNTASYHGGGVYVSRGTFTMSGGEISGNMASSTYSCCGGGVSVSGGTFMMSGGEISGNTASSTYPSSGGGVYVYTIGTFTMSGGTISRNTASSASSSYGGGVYVSGTFEMSNGEISGNTASSTYPSNGGGMYVYSTGTFTKQAGGVIYGANASDSLKNTATSGNDYGHAVYVDSSPAKKRNTTAGTGVMLDSTKDGTAGGWE